MVENINISKKTYCIVPESRDYLIGKERGQLVPPRVYSGSTKSQILECNLFSTSSFARQPRQEVLVHSFPTLPVSFSSIYLSVFSSLFFPPLISRI